MGGGKPKPMQTPYQQTNTYGTYSVADTPEAKAFLSTPLDFGQGAYSGKAYEDIPTEFDLDPGVGHRTALAEQEVGNRWDSAFNAGVPAWIRNMNRAKEVRDVQSQGAAERQQAEYGRQQLRSNAMTQRAQMRDAAELAKAGMAGQTTMAELGRRERVLPQYMSTGNSGYGTQIVQPQPGFLSNLGSGLGAGIGSALKFPTI